MSARLLDVRDAVEARFESSVMWVRVGMPVVLWAVLALGAGVVAATVLRADDASNKWMGVMFAAACLSLFAGTGATPRRGLPGRAGLAAGVVAAVFVFGADDMPVWVRGLLAAGAFVLVQRGRDRVVAGAWPRAVVWLCVVLGAAGVAAVAGKDAPEALAGAAAAGAVLAGVRLVGLQVANRRSVGGGQGRGKVLRGGLLGLAGGAMKPVKGSSNFMGAALAFVAFLVAAVAVPWVAVIGVANVSGASRWASAAFLVLGWVVAGRVAAWFPAGQGVPAFEAMRDRVADARAAGPVVKGSPVSEDGPVVDGGASVPTMLKDALVPTSLLVGKDMASGAWKGVTPHMVVVASSGSGKTRRIIAPNVISHDGPVVTATTKDDIALLTTSARRQVGKVWFFDPSGSLPVPAGCTVARWSPLSLVLDKDSALRVAGNLISAGNIASGQSDTGKFFADQASEMLACLMLASVLEKGGPDGAVRQMMTWLDGGPSTWEDAAVALDDAGEVGFATRVRGLMTEAAGAGERRVADTVATARQILSVYRRDRVVMDADNPNLSLHQFAVSAGDTIHIAMVADEQKALGPLIGLFCDAVIAARRSAPKEARDNIILLALDELASIPLTGLSSYLSEARSWGVRVLGGLQTLAQLDKWGNEGKALKMLFPFIVIMNNCNDNDLVQEVSLFQGEKIVHRHGRSEQHSTFAKTAFKAGVSGGHNLGSSPTDSISEQTERVLKIDEVTGLIPDGHVRLIKNRADMGVFYAPDVSEGVWGEVREVMDARLAEDMAAAAAPSVPAAVVEPVGAEVVPVGGETVSGGVGAAGDTFEDMPLDPFDGVPFGWDEPPFDEERDGR